MTREQRTLTMHAAIRALLTFGFTLLIANLTQSGEIDLFIAPRMMLLVKLSAIGLYVIAVFHAYSAIRYAFRTPPSCDCEHQPQGSWLKHALIYGLIALPLALGMLLPNTTMGSAIAAKKGMNLSAADTYRISSDAQETAARTAADIDERFAADVYNEDFAELAKQLYMRENIEVEDRLFMEILTSVDLFLDAFIGKTITIEGFVYRDDAMAENRFVIGRFAMDCCSADALPYGVMVEYDKAGRYQNDAWLSVRGTIGKTEYEGREIMIIKPQEIARAAEPESPYVYPNYDF